jgi:hypothetical protein
MENNINTKLKKQQERELLDEYHKLETEQALEPLYQSFMEWKQGTLPYFELTELIHLFHKKNQGRSTKTLITQVAKNSFSLQK